MPPLDRRTFLARTAVVCASPLALAACPGTDTTPATSQYATAVRRVMAQWGFPGALVSVRRPGDDEWKQAFGYGNVAAGTPIDPASHFPIRSITKSFTGTLLLQLAPDKVDTPIAAWFPYIPNADTITLGDLAGMQSGVADYSATKEFQADFGKDISRTFTQQQLVDYALPYSPSFEPPKSQYEYSNTNTVMLGMILEQITGETLAALMQRLIIAPLGLTGTTYPYVTPVPPPSPTPYEIDLATGALEVLPLISPTSLAGAGAMTSTLDDLQVWAGALGDGRLIGSALQAERIERSRVVTNGPEYDRYGLAIGILKGWWGHTGTGIGWQVATMYDPKTKATISVMVNSTPFNPPRRDLNFAQEIFEAVAAVVGSE